MSKQLRELVIEPIGDKRYRVVLDGADISSSCKSITIQMDVDRVPLVNIVMYLRSAVRVDADVIVESIGVKADEAQG